MKQLHLWLSLPVGLVISITCFSGAMLIFEREITESVQREYYFVEEVGTQRISFEDAIAAVEPMLDGEQRITGITTSSDLERAWKVNLSSPKGAAVYVDQYSGEVLGTPERLPLFSTMFRLHRWLMDSRPADGGVISPSVFHREFPRALILLHNMGHQAQVVFNEHISGRRVSCSGPGQIVGFLCFRQRFGERSGIQLQGIQQRAQHQPGGCTHTHHLALLYSSRFVQFPAPDAKIPCGILPPQGIYCYSRFSSDRKNLFRAFQPISSNRGSRFSSICSR